MERSNAAKNATRQSSSIRFPFDFADYAENGQKYKSFKTARIAESFDGWPFHVGDRVGIVYQGEKENVALHGHPVVPMYQIIGTNIIAFGNALGDFVL